MAIDPNAVFDEAPQNQPIDISNNRPPKREGFLRDMKPEGCTCQWPNVICKNVVGHPRSCGAYARLYAQLSPRKAGTR